VPVGEAEDTGHVGRRVRQIVRHVERHAGPPFIRGGSAHRDGDLESLVDGGGQPGLLRALAQAHDPDPPRVHVRPREQVVQGPERVEHLDSHHLGPGRGGRPVQTGKGSDAFPHVRIVDEDHEAALSGHVVHEGAVALLAQLAEPAGRHDEGGQTRRLVLRLRARGWPDHVGRYIGPLGPEVHHVLDHEIALRARGDRLGPHRLARREAQGPRHLPAQRLAALFPRGPLRRHRRQLGGHAAGALGKVAHHAHARGPLRLRSPANRRHQRPQDRQTDPTPSPSVPGERVNPRPAVCHVRAWVHMHAMTPLSTVLLYQFAGGFGNRGPRLRVRAGWLAAGPRLV